jgi:hypothetical protein
MAWERGYYYRVRKVNGRVLRAYIGSGRLAELAAQVDALERKRRQTEAEQLRQEKAELDTLLAGLKTLAELTSLVARAALLAAGFHQHKRGEWRAKREKDSNGASGRDAAG